ncbi:putative flavin reductase [Actinoplanes missouriensis 431]|uniref:Putative flavin reductase n=1 Tax=Actinoplanes missouriensis (strain ATCC 14538 / DSM 43046 / CBS 188.64 / JCM 3121 / NBRC 102363 / NCIMB 12654 / NRRL B-3342 / UNCC 431) TaxID=512565 RepID=I0H4J9_ACTM4|nr:flavin reductase family protein [Actinoplanes missouriensis]BAL87936.1 putative flavin reductase [Actinoplanes missouriensis 431]
MQMAPADLRSQPKSWELRQIYGCFPTGVAAVCAAGARGRPIGTAVTGFTPVSLDPPLVGINVLMTSTTWPRLKAAPRIGISVLSQDHDRAAVLLAAGASDWVTETPHVITAGGAVLIDGATAWLECAVDAQHRAGDHMIVLLRVLSCAGDPSHHPLVVHGNRFHRLREL